MRPGLAWERKERIIFFRCFSLSLFCSSFVRFEFNVFFVLCFVESFRCGVDRMFPAAGEIRCFPL